LLRGVAHDLERERVALVALALDLDRDAWTRIICAGLKAGEITLPQKGVLR
jgi:hypothetical protein